MNIKLENELVKKYPKYFDYLKEHKSKVILPIMFGFECNDGWYHILSNLMDSIYRYCESNNVKVPDVLQVKEKYGQLEFYTQGGDELIDGMIWFAGDLSRHTCEFCGTTKNVNQTEGWIYTVCDECYIKEKITQPKYKKDEI